MIFLIQHLELVNNKAIFKFWGKVMSALNTHHIPAFYHVFGSFQLVISVFIVVYLILGFSCIASEKGWHLEAV